ncbi:MAG: ATP-binding protein [Thermoanaerobaculia bacterium]|nr:ATP-binding protein [Thermoanaerobaculia bacterium]
MPGQQLSLVVEKELSGFGRLLPELDRFVEENQLEPRIGYTLRLVMEEVVLNLINYSKSGQRTNEIRVFLSALPDQVRLAIEDDGTPFDPRNAPAAPLPANLAEAAPGGIGLHLVRSMVDELSYDSTEERNRLEVRIVRSAAPSAR